MTDYRKRISIGWAVALCVLALLVCTCAGDDDDDNDTSDTAPGDDDDSASDDDDEEGGPYYDPTWVVSTDVLPKIRDYTDIRGIIHSHSIYSHDACDNEPVGNTLCLEQKRRAFCDTKQDYIMLTDHPDRFAEIEFPDVLLYDPAAGDVLLDDDESRSYANRLACADGTSVTLFAGFEDDLMPIHMHRHAVESVPDRYDLYNRRDADAADALRTAGGYVVVNHSEQWSVDELVALAPDGIEVFNLHAAIDPTIRPYLDVGGWDVILDLFGFLNDDGHPELAIISFWPETTAWSDRWDAMLAHQRCLGIAATDDHRNALPFVLSDGDRADSFRRMEHWFSNHLLVEDEEPATIADALDHGRLYLAFEYLGIPIGFDFHLADGETVYEMGDVAPASSTLGAVVSIPEGYAIDPDAIQPTIRARVIHVASSGARSEFEVVEGETIAAASPGSYRAEVWIVPTHLLPYLGADPWVYVKEYPWVLSNPVYVE